MTHPTPPPTEAQHAPRRDAREQLPVLTQIVVRLPLPARELHQNGSQVHYRRLAAARTAARHEGRLASCDALGLCIPPVWVRCRCSVQFRWPDRVRRDTSNYFAACKHFFDGVTDAGIWEDDERVIWHIPEATVGNRQDAGVTLTITPIEEGAAP